MRGSAIRACDVAGATDQDPVGLAGAPGPTEWCVSASHERSGHVALATSSRPPVPCALRSAITMWWLVAIVAVVALLIFLADRRTKRHGGTTNSQARGPDQQGPPTGGVGLP